MKMQRRKNKMTIKIKLFLSNKFFLEFKMRKRGQ
jgi:hypothetical protein